ncbi:MAG: hypothetical protein QF594_05265 [Dehalococcoidales bacterium]|jgi:hypothetical protein|nr:hypothetical protein [Dehalococcoidales bacterium]|tara:strand:- start:87 stop:311 length:225 start_codon:yes stop_codon:yes gene_type:complete
MEGQRAEALAVCACEFRGAKIKETRMTYDRLLIAKQAAKGWLPKKLVNSIIQAGGKGIALALLYVLVGKEVSAR